MSEICPICGLPKDLCVCEAISKEEQQIRIRLERRKGRREVTIVEGIDEKDFDLSSLATKLKSRLACGGTAKNGRIELQGDHREKVKNILVEMGFPVENIIVE
ncbi:MAG: stress response translation initiation inhibitor YciH [Thermoprotei archaeon]|nr:MAG: stress response translation initiation inhibitor YciH [Thermoprotei archaeon]RLE98814.1 MAG: stress response translation initiation inhibitor YciH [Thermoprotei archaeon]